MESSTVPDEETLTQEVQATAQAICDSIKETSYKETARFLNSLPDYVIKTLFPASSQFEENHNDKPVTEIPKPAKEFLPLACEKGDLNLLFVLLNVGADPKIKGAKGSPLAVATTYNHRPVIDKLISWDPGVLNDLADVKECLKIACEAGLTDLVTFWLEYLGRLCGHQVSAADFGPHNDPVGAACKGGHVEIAAKLLQDGVSYISKEMASAFPETLAKVLNTWVEQHTDKPEKLVAKWTKKNIHVLNHSWLQMPAYTDALLSIDLSHNALSTIPGNLLWGLPWLEKLVITHNALVKLPVPVSGDQLDTLRLKVLNLANNHLKTVPAEVFMLQKLEYLSLADNHLESINPAHIMRTSIAEQSRITWKCESLIRLILSNNNLLRIPADIEVTRQLKKLDVSHNKLKEVPAPWDCPLEELYLHHNSITDVPDMHVCWNKTLKLLNISDNKLPEIPWTICRLQSLMDLKIARNNIWRLPSINEWGIHNLQMLDVSGNLLVHLDPIKSRSMSNASTISQSSIDERSRILSTSSEGKKRNISGSSDDKTQTPSPKQEKASNFFIGLDQEIDVQILLFPSSFHTSLRLLDLSCNQLQAVPDSVCEMKSLQCLYLHGNGGLTRLPEKLALLAHLYSLRVDPDQIQHPSEVSAIMKDDDKRRTTARIMNLLLEKHHKSMPYKGVKVMIVGPEKCGKTSLLTCLTNSDWPENDKGVNIQTWKVSENIASEPHSSLGRRLFKRPSLEENEITFTIWDLKGGETYSVIHQTLFTPHTLYLLVWDLKDKEAGIHKLKPWILNIQAQAPMSTIITVGTHLDKLPSNSEKRYQIIESLHQSFHQSFPRLRESSITQKRFVEVQATGANGAGIRELKEEIVNCAMTMMYTKSNKTGVADDLLIGRKVPRAFIDLRGHVLGELKNRQASFPPRPPIMTEATLMNHVRSLPECHMNSVKDLEEAVSFLRDSGSLVHVGDHTYGLTNLYFLDPAWLCTVLLAVVKLKDTMQINDCMVTNATLQNLCEESGFGKDMFDEYIQLLARFEIALPASLKRFVIPSLLPKVAPGIELTRFPQFSEKLERWYKMAYIPPGFWSRLVSRMMVNIRQMDNKLGERRTRSSMRKPSHGSLHMRQTQTMVWQEGIFVSFTTGQLKVEPMLFADDNKPGIRVTVRSQQQLFKPMGFVVDHIETLLSEWYPGLDDQQNDGEPLIERLVPCPVCYELALQNEDPYSPTPRSIHDDIHIFKLKQLVVLATLKAQEHVQCPVHKNEPLSLKQLLPDVFLIDLRVDYLMSEKLDIGRCLGRGGFGEVFKADYNGRQVAVKKLLKGLDQQLPTLDDDYRQEEQEISVLYKFPQLRSEVAMMSRLKHPCIIKLIGVSIQQLSFAMEFAPLGDLDSYVGRKFKELKPQFVSERTIHRTILPKMLTYKITHQVAMAIQYLHKMRVIHTDLKTDNVLVCSVDTSDRVNVKLADYGISHTMFGGGVKGAAGFHAFCAPEILRGKAFDEKVDWFSYGMLVYHIMSGLLPFHNLQSSIEAKTVVTAGVRPKLTYPNYTLEPRFAHLEGLMNWCWKDDPTDRPNKEEVLFAMRDASFLCLRHKIELDSEVNNCLYSPTSSQIEVDELRQYRMWLWKGDGEGRKYNKFNIEHSAQMRPKDCSGKAVTCALQFGEFHVLGTDSGIEVYGTQGTGRQLFTHLKSLSVTAKVTALFYKPLLTKRANFRTICHLFVGQQDGIIAIFAHVKPNRDGNLTFDMIQLKTLTLSTVPKPCLCMNLIPDSNELWVSCGNTVRILCTQDLLLDPTVITVAPSDNQLVGGIVCRGDQVWCYIQNSFHVIQYNAKTWLWVDTLQCGSITPTKQQCLSNPVTSNHPLHQKRVGFEDSSSSKLEEQEEEQEEEPEEDVDDDSGNDVDAEAEEELTFHDNHFEKPPVARNFVKQKRATVPAGMRRRRESGGLRRRSRPFSDSVIPSRAPLFAKVTSLLVVKETLWIGRDTGDIIITNIDKDNPYDYSFGEVIAVLSVQSFLNWSHGPIRQLLPVGSDRVVARRDVSGPDKQLKHQLLVWEKWGCKDINEFEEVHVGLSKAKREESLMMSPANSVDSES